MLELYFCRHLAKEHLHAKSFMHLQFVIQVRNIGASRTARASTTCGLSILVIVASTRS